MNRRLAVTLGVTLAVQVAALGAVSLPRLSVRLTGEEYRLRVRPVDPIDPFRGAYVDLYYDGFTDTGFAYTELEGRVYVPLRRDGDTWVGAHVTKRRPATGPYVSCEAAGRVECGIESWFASQRRAKQLESELGDGGVAVVRISDSGRAVLVGLEP